MTQRHVYRFLSAQSRNFFLVMLLLFACADGLWAEPRPLNYAAVAVRDREATITAHGGIAATLSAATNTSIRIVFGYNNQELVQALINGDIDIAYLGPLPYVVAAEKLPELEVLAAINEESGAPGYRCALVSAHDGPAGITDISGSIALVNPLSTCGNLTMAYLLANHGIDIETLDYHFIGNHESVAIDVIRGLYSAGGIRDEVAQKYQGLLLHVLDTTPPLPGFVLVANPNSFSGTEIERMRTALLHAKPTDYQSWGVGNHGFSPASQLDYDFIHRLMTPVFQQLFLAEFYDY